MWVRRLGAGVVLLVAVLLAVSVTATPPPSVTAVVVLEGESAPETSSRPGPVAIPPQVVGLGEPAPEETVGEPSDDETEGDDSLEDDEDAHSSSLTGTTRPDGPGGDDVDSDDEPPGDDDADDDEADD